MPETCRAKNTSIKLPCFNKLAFHFIFIKNSNWNDCLAMGMSARSDAEYVYVAYGLFVFQYFYSLLLII